MTDNEISKALALAIGWKDVETLGGHVLVRTGNPGDKVYFRKRGNFVHNHRIFDYKEWSVIGPIAERYDCFPYLDSMHKWDVMNLERYYSEDTPQKAIALAVIASQGEMK